MPSLYRFILRAEAFLAGVLLMAMVALIFAGGVARMMHTPINWTIDLATCAFAWASFLCADIAWRRGALMSIDILPEMVPAGARRVLEYVNYGLIAIFLVCGIYAGTLLAWISRARSFQGIPGISYSWVTMSLPVGCLLLLVTTLLKIRDARRAAVSAEGASPSC